MYESDLIRVYCVFRSDRLVRSFSTHCMAMEYIDHVKSLEPYADWQFRHLDCSADFVATMADFTLSVNYLCDQAKRSRLALALLADDSDLVREAISDLS